MSNIIKMLLTFLTKIILDDEELKVFNKVKKARKKEKDRS